MMQFLTKFIVSSNRVGHQNLFCVRWMVPEVPGWPELGDAYSNSRTAERKFSGTRSSVRIEHVVLGRRTSRQRRCACVSLRNLGHDVPLNGSDNLGLGDDGFRRRVLVGLIVQARQSVGFSVLGSQSVGDSEIKVRKEHGPSCLAGVHSFGRA